MTTEKESIKRQLDRFGYDYQEGEQGFEVKLGFNLHTTIDLSQDGRVLLTDRLEEWNLLTGVLRTKDLARAIRYTWIWLAVVWVIVLFLDAAWGHKNVTIRAILMPQLLTLIAVTALLSGTMFYLARAEGFRQTVMIWLKDR